MKNINYIGWVILMFIGSPLLSQNVQWATQVIEASSELNSDRNSATQAIGRPDALEFENENAKAWMPLRSNEKQYLKLAFNTAMAVAQIAVAESSNPGAISRIYLTNDKGEDHLVFILKPSVQKAVKGIYNFYLDKTKYLVKGVKLEFDGTTDKPYAIDAVAIADTQNRILEEQTLIEFFSKGIFVAPLGKNINSSYSETGPLLSNDGQTLYFSRPNHPENKGGDADHEDIWQAKLSPDGKWGLAENMNTHLNTEEPNYINSIFDHEGKPFLLLGNEYLPNGKSIAGISISTLENGQWTFPKPLELIKTENKSMRANFSMSHIKKNLLMSIQSTKSFGDRDIYVSFQKNDSVWEEPLNLGNVVNTPGEESAPFLASNGRTLYYSSNGLKGYGGADIFVSNRLDDTWNNWSTPINLGTDINTSSNEYFFNIPTHGPYAHFNRQVSENNLDIYQLKLNIYKVIDPKMTVRGKLLDSRTGNGIKNGYIIYENQLDGQEMVMAQSNDESIQKEKPGEYEIHIPIGKFYKTKIIADTYKPIEEVIDLSASPEGTVLTKDYKLEPIISFIVVRGRLLNKKGNPINSKIVFQQQSGGIEGKEIGYCQSDPISGNYEIKIPGARHYITKITGYKTDNPDLDLTSVNIDEMVINKDFIASPIKAVETITLNALSLFDSGSDILKRESYIEFSKVVNIMTTKANYLVEVVGHTDASGNDIANLDLSARRAKAVEKYFTNSGIPSDRISTKYYGESRPIVTNNTLAGRRKNRRVELKFYLQD